MRFFPKREGKKPIRVDFLRSAGAQAQAERQYPSELSIALSFAALLTSSTLCRDSETIKRDLLLLSLLTMLESVI